MSLDPVASRLAATGVAFASQIESAARRYGLDPSLLAAVAAQETGGPDTNAGHNIVGDGGHGHGIFQIDDRWHPFASTGAAMDPGKNADYAAGMLSGLLKRYGGNVHEALSAYNSGSPTSSRHQNALGRRRRPRICRLGDAPLLTPNGQPGARGIGAVHRDCRIERRCLLCGGARSRGAELPLAGALAAGTFVAEHLARAFVPSAVNRLHVASGRRHRRDRLVEKEITR